MRWPPMEATAAGQHDQIILAHKLLYIGPAPRSTGFRISRDGVTEPRCALRDRTRELILQVDCAANDRGL